EKEIELDTCKRIGEYQENRHRPIRVRFRGHDDRIFVFENRKKLPEGVSHAFDLPQHIRETDNLQLAKRHELKGEGTESKIDW
ncbi:hypothetical protein, partial [Staphylococcus sp. 52716]|uniref:hypothetical protein n=1 Tax=Staphylococcus sp. 52716 TaxID=2608398 RepID=UPI001CB76584